MEDLVAGPATWVLRAGAATATGRDRNEDAWLCGRVWFVVADGVGGRAGGDVASRATVELLADRPAPTSIDEVVAALQEINSAVRERARSSSISGSASTVAGLVLTTVGPAVFHVGDSRCYRLIGGQLDSLTRDHSYVQDLVDAGRITAAEAEHHRHRNIITRALGADPVVVPDVRLVVRPIGRVLLCTDGVSTATTTEEIAAVLTDHHDPRDAAEQLVLTAVANGTTDDATAVVVDLGDDEAADPRDDLDERGAAHDSGPTGPSWIGRP